MEQYNPAAAALLNTFSESRPEIDNVPTQDPEGETAAGSAFATLRG